MASTIFFRNRAMTSWFSCRLTKQAHRGGDLAARPVVSAANNHTHAGTHTRVELALRTLVSAANNHTHAGTHRGVDIAPGFSCR